MLILHLLCLVVVFCHTPVTCLIYVEEYDKSYASSAPVIGGERLNQERGYYDKAYLHLIPENPSLCNQQYHQGSTNVSGGISNNNNNTNSEVIQQEGEPIALLARGGKCNVSDQVLVAKTYGDQIKYVIVYNSEENNDSSRLYDVQESFDNNGNYNNTTPVSNIVVLSISYEDGMEFEDYILHKQNYSATAETATNSIYRSSDISQVEEGLFIQMDLLGPKVLGPLFRGRKLVEQILPKIFAIGSALGSLYIICNLIWSKKVRFNLNNINRAGAVGTFNRLLFCLSVFDVLSSIAFVFSFWAIPAEAPDGYFRLIRPEEENIYDAYFPNAHGNTTTCSIQGFFVQLGAMGSTCFTGFIALQYVFTVKLKWSKATMRKAEKYFYVIGTLLPLLLSIIPTCMGAMNATGAGFCWLTQYPFNCARANHIVDPLRLEWCGTFPRGNEAFMFRLLSCGLVVIVFLTITVSMTLMFLTVREHEFNSSKWSSTFTLKRNSNTEISDRRKAMRRRSSIGDIFSSNKRTRMQKQTIKKSMCLIGAFLIVWTPGVVNVFYHYTGGSLITSISISMQGLFNVVIHYLANNSRQKKRKKKRVILRAPSSFPPKVSFGDDSANNGNNSISASGNNIDNILMDSFSSTRF